MRAIYHDLFYSLDLVGVAVFAVSGVLAARDLRHCGHRGDRGLLGAECIGLPRPFAFGGEMSVVVVLWLIAMRWRLHLPVFYKP